MCTAEWKNRHRISLVLVCDESRASPLSDLPREIASPAFSSHVFVVLRGIERCGCLTSVNRLDPC